MTECVNPDCDEECGEAIYCSYGCFEGDDDAVEHVEEAKDGPTAEGLSVPSSVAVDGPDRAAVHQAVRDEALRQNRQFVEDVLDGAEHRLRAEPLDVEAVERGLERLHESGYDPTDAGPVVYCGRALWRELTDDYESRVRVDRDPGALSPPTQINIHEAACYHEPAVPDTRALMVHPDAVAPTLLDSWKPWTVRGAGGLVAYGGEE